MTRTATTTAADGGINDKQQKRRRYVSFELTVTPELIRSIDDQRGGITRSLWIRRAIIQKLKSDNPDFIDPTSATAATAAAPETTMKKRSSRRK
jgi:hypothetical protein